MECSQGQTMCVHLRRGELCHSYVHFPSKEAFVFPKMKDIYIYIKTIFLSNIGIFQIQWNSILNSVEWWFKAYLLSTHEMHAVDATANNNRDVYVC